MVSTVGNSVSVIVMERTMSKRQEGFTQHPVLALKKMTIEL